MQQLGDILKDLKMRAVAEAAVVTSSDGLVLSAVQDDGIDLESLAAYAAHNMTASERIGESAQCGMPESVIIIYQGKVLVMAPLGPVVAMLLGPGAQLGNLRLQLKRSLAELSAALEDELDPPSANERPSPSQRDPGPAHQRKPEPVRQSEPEPEQLEPEPVHQHKPEPPRQREPEQVQQVVQKSPAPSVDPELNGNGRRAVNPPLRGSSINLR